MRWGSDKDGFHTEVAQHHLKLSELIMYANNEDVRKHVVPTRALVYPFRPIRLTGSSPSAAILLDLVSSQAVPRLDGRGARVQSGKHGRHCAPNFGDIRIWDINKLPSRPHVQGRNGNPATIAIQQAYC